jgi:hypothetical protein
MEIAQGHPFVQLINMLIKKQNIIVLHTFYHCSGLRKIEVSPVNISHKKKKTGQHYEINIFSCTS